MARTPKDAIVLCLDVGPGMTQAPPGMDTPLESSMKIISMMVQRKIFSESKDELALVLFGTEGTMNDLAAEDSESYQNITVMHPLCIPGFELLETVSRIEPGPEESDFVDAITVSLDILHKQTIGKKIEFRRLVLFTNFDHQFSDDSLEGIINGFNCENESVQLNVIAPQFEEPPPSEDEEDSGSDGEGPSVKRQRLTPRQSILEKTKTPQQRAGERVVTYMLAEGVEGCVYSYEQAIPALTWFEKKSVRSAAWKCNLTLGSDLVIPCAAYVRTKAATLKKSWTKCYAKTHRSEDLLKQNYYFRQDNEQTEVPKEDIGKGYRYGKDVIPITKEDEEKMKYKTEQKCLAILGFTNASNVRIQDLMDDQAHVIMALEDDEAAITALAAIATALQNLNMCAIARYVYRKGLDPKMMALLPKVKDSHQCLVMVPLPFVEDMRSLEFPSLESKKNPKPSLEQLSAIDSLIDAMDLTNSEQQLYKPQDMPNPYFQRVYQSLNHRALNTGALPDPDSRIENILSPNQAITERSRDAAAAVTSCFKLVKEEVKAKKAAGIDTWADVKVDQAKIADEKAGGDASSVSSLSEVFSTTVQSVGSVTPDQDFIELTKDCNDEAKLKLVLEQLQQRILEFVMDSFFYAMHGCNKKVLQCLLVMRNIVQEKKMVHVYNDFLRALKITLLKDRSKIKYWDQLVSNNISLIGGAGVTEDEISNFLKLASTEEAKTEIKQEEEEDFEDLLDEL